jgi:hypothetical protein
MKLRKDIDSLFDMIQSRLPDSGDDMLEALGLQRRRSIAAAILPAIGTLTFGLAVGAAIGTVFGPRYGYKLMDRVGVKIPESLKEGIKETERRPASSHATGTVSTGAAATTPNNATSSLRARSDVHS